MDDSVGQQGAKSAQGETSAGPTPRPEVRDHVLVRRIGQGAYGEVWLGRNVLGSPRAVKVVYRSAFPTARPYEREFNGIQRFEPISRSHDGLINILQIGRPDHDTYFYYVMELADPMPEPTQSPGPHTSLISQAELFFDEATYRPRTLSAELCTQGRLSFGECLRLALSLADALHHLHGQGLVHRDIKPSNIIFVRGAAKLADIGLVTDRGEERSWVGTEGYIPPEGPGKPSADVYSLGKVLYQISTGKDRTRFPEPLTRLAELPDHEDWREFNEVVNRACEPDQRLRYQSAAELRTDLVLLSGGKSVRRLRRIERSWKRAQYVVAAVSLLLLGGLVTYLAVQAQANARTRHIELLRQAQESRSNPRVAGWRERSWAVLRQATAIRTSKEARDQAAATLAGFDARLIGTIPSDAFAVAFSADAQQLLVNGASKGGGLQRTDPSRPAGLSIVRSTLPGTGPVVSRPDGTAWRFETNLQGQIIIQDMRDSSLIRTLEFPSSPATDRVATSVQIGLISVTPDGALVAAKTTGSAAGTPPTVLVWNGETGALLHRLVADVSCLSFTPDHSLLAGGETTGRIRFWSSVDGREVRAPLEPASDGKGRAVTRLAFARRPIYPEPIGLERWTLASGDATGLITLWDPAAGQVYRQLSTPHVQIEVLAFSPDGTVLASGGRESPQLWDAFSGESLLILDTADQITGLAFSPDAARIAVTSRTGVYPGGVWIWELENGRGIQRFRGLERSLTYACFDPSGNFVAALSQNWRMGLWSLRTRQLVAELKVEPGLSSDNAALAFKPDGTEFAFASGQSTEVWDLRTWQVKRYSLPRGLGERLMCRPTGEFLLTRQETLHDSAPSGRWWAPPDKDPRVWRVRDLHSAHPTEPIAMMSAPNRRLTTALISPSGDKVIIEGPTVEDERTNRWLVAFDPTTGRGLWTNRLTKTRQSTGMAIDSTGRWLTADITDAPGSHLIDADSGAILEELPQQVAAMHGRAQRKLVIAKGPTPRASGYSLFVGSAAEPVLTVLTGGSCFHIPALSLNGERLAWTVNDGSVMVCDLPKLRAELAKLKLDWKEPRGKHEGQAK